MIGRKFLNQVEGVCVSKRVGIYIKMGGTNIRTPILILTDHAIMRFATAIQLGSNRVLRSHTERDLLLTKQQLVY